MMGYDRYLIFVILNVFKFQGLCLPIFCPSYQMWIGERCVPVVTKIYSHGILLSLMSISIDGIVPSPKYITKEKAKNMVRSRCLDLKWSKIIVIAEYGEDTNVTRALYVTLIKTFNNEKELDFSKTLTKYTACIPSAWEILINGRWIPVNMSFTSGAFNGRIVPSSETIGRPSTRITNSFYRTYSITKTDYCKQVNMRFNEYIKQWPLPQLVRHLNQTKLSV